MKDMKPHISTLAFTPHSWRGGRCGSLALNQSFCSAALLAPLPSPLPVPKSLLYQGLVGPLVDRHYVAQMPMPIRAPRACRVRLVRLAQAGYRFAAQRPMRRRADVAVGRLSHSWPTRPPHQGTSVYASARLASETSRPTVRRGLSATASCPGTASADRPGAGSACVVQRSTVVAPVRPAAAFSQHTGQDHRPSPRTRSRRLNPLF